tara:strand:- start:76 stop:312 length:237 start_codon:yes stop_codon:yes gene_type:complete
MVNLYYLNLSEARELLSEMGIKLNVRQMQRAAEMDAEGRRKLPFFVDPIDGKLKIERQALVDAYKQRHRLATRNLRPG